MSKKKPLPANKNSEEKDGQVVELLAPESEAHLLREKKTITLAELHVGPLPHADDFARYEEVNPGTAKVILEMAIENQRSAIASKKRGQWMTFIDSMFGQIAGLASFALVVGGSLWMLTWLVERNAGKASYWVLGAFLAAGVFATIRKFVDGRK